MAAIYKDIVEEEQRMINRVGTHSAHLHRFSPKISGSLEGD